MIITLYFSLLILSAYITKFDNSILAKIGQIPAQKIYHLFRQISGTGQDDIGPKIGLKVKKMYKNHSPYCWNVLLP